MDEKRNTGEFDLEDILKEFGDADLQPEEDVLIWGEEPQQKPAPATAPQDTVRLDQITEAVRKQEAELEQTVAFEPVEALDQTIAFTPVGDLEQTIAFEPIAEDPPKAEPYSEEWEPEYEQPISEYVPPEPIVQRPKSRLRELKKKLVAGPEKRYYELTELGLGKLQLAIFVNLVVALISAGATAMYTMGAVPEDRTRLLIFIQFLALLFSGLLGSYQLLEGFGDMLRLRFSLNSLLVFSLVACLVDSVLCLQSLRVPCCAVFSLHMTMALWSAYQKRNTEMGQMDTMRKAVRLDSVVSVPDYYEGNTGFLRGEGQVEDFMDTYSKPSGVERTMSIYALVSLAVSLAIGITAGVLHSAEFGCQAFAAALLVSVPASSFIAISRPMAILERRLHRLGTVICGWEGVKGLSQEGVFPLNDTDLFPAGSAKMNGVKFYGTRDPDTVVAYGTALISACGGGMEPLFNALLDSRNGYHYTAKELRSYPSGGVGGEVNGEPVLAGTLRFMQDMGVEMPAGTKINQAVYVAIDGQLGGVFAITYGKIRATAAAMTTLCAYRKLTPVLTTSDFMLTESFIRGRFGVNTKRIAFPERAVRCELAEIQPEEGIPALALNTQEGLAGPAFAVTGARAVRKACRLGVAVHMLGGILGLTMMLLLAILGAEHLLTPANVLLYQLIWMIPGLLFTEWARSV
ncbi:MAG: hypothetical protein J6A88_07285 [Oscillospiraceae bacterium]|nr:hypothetical protein [Oscillospiraceae bacterium]